MRRSRAPSSLHKAQNSLSEKSSTTVLQAETTKLAVSNKTKKNDETKAVASTTPRQKFCGLSSTIEKPIAVQEPSPLVFTCFWCKLTTKKHKTMDDGILLVKGSTCTLHDMEGKVIAKTNSYSKKALADLKEGNTLTFGGKELEIDREQSYENFLSGSIFIKSEEVQPQQPIKPTLATSVINAKPLFAKSVKRPEPRYNPNLPGAIILQKETEKTAAVVLDPYIGCHLRQHQIEGVKFLYEGVMGLRQEGYSGCLLADEMGLGKTLQSICLLWTLLKQGPNGVPVIKKALIVCPNSLINGWRKEIIHWLGRERIDPLVLGECNKTKTQETLRCFSKDNKTTLIISYEQFLRNVDVFNTDSVGLLICDEGHRLKNASSKTAMALAALKTRRRVLLSGTPIQNDLGEFFTMIDFCCPGLLGTPSSFKRVFETPITRGQAPTTSPAEREIGYRRADELGKMISRICLRRLSTILADFLPKKLELVLFCRPTPRQCECYQKLLASKEVTKALTGDGSQALVCMQALVKLCNHPQLVASQENELFADVLEPRATREDKAEPAEPAATAHGTPSTVVTAEDSGKLVVLLALLKEIKEKTNDKVVLVSNYTKTLDLFEKVLGEYRYLRLDGAVATNERQHLVDRFNDQADPSFIFLLSSKAGGVGLNLQGANRIVLFDPDWNPARDRQAMARVWRDGQKKPVFIYRLITTGTIEEKIYQRQLSKQNLSANIVLEQFEAKQTSFNPDMLKKIFRFRTDTVCDTHDISRCGCLKTGHVNTPGVRHLTSLKDVHDPIAAAADSSNTVTFVIETETNPKEESCPAKRQRDKTTEDDKDSLCDETDENNEDEQEEKHVAIESGGDEENGELIYAKEHESEESSCAEEKDQVVNKRRKIVDDVDC